jgi:hypothetical protein
MLGMIPSPSTAAASTDTSTTGRSANEVKAATPVAVAPTTTITSIGLTSSSSGVSRVNNDIWCFIFQFCAPRFVMHNIAYVCHQWFHIINNGNGKESAKFWNAYWHQLFPFVALPTKLTLPQLRLLIITYRSASLVSASSF